MALKIDQDKLAAFKLVARAFASHLREGGPIHGFTTTSVDAMLALGSAFCLLSLGQAGEACYAAADALAESAHRE